LAGVARLRSRAAPADFDEEASLALGAGVRPLPALRAAVEAIGEAACGASALPGGVGVLARVLAADGAALRGALLRAWAAARAALGLPPGKARPK
jgi:hypothetical protein